MPGSRSSGATRSWQRSGGFLAIGRGLRGEAGRPRCRAGDGRRAGLSRNFSSASAMPVSCTAECRLYQAGTPYFPVRTLLGTVLARTTAMDPAETEAVLRDTVARAAPELTQWLALLGVVLDLDDRGIAARWPNSTISSDRPAPQFGRVSLMAALVELRPSSSSKTPTGWTRRPRRSLTALLAELGERPWMFILTRRPGVQGFVDHGLGCDAR